MFRIRAAGVLVAGGVFLGCQASSTPKASVAVQPVSDTTMAGLEQSWRSAHPGALVGHVNGVLPDRHILSVAGLPPDQINPGDVVTILLSGQPNNTITARVYAKASGYVQMDYGNAQSPQVGDLAVWYPGGLAVPPPANEPSTLTPPPTTGAPATPPPAGAAPEAMPGAPGAPAAPTTPPPTTPETTPPGTPPATAPAAPGTPPAADSATPPAPTTPPATPATPAPADAGTPPPAAPPATPPAAGTEAPAPGSTPAPAPAPDNKPPADLNK